MSIPRLGSVEPSAGIGPGDEGIASADPGFAITGGKFFAMFSNQHHNDGIIALLVKTSGEEEQAMLIEQDDETYYRPQYYGPAGWIGIRLDLGRNDWDHIGEWLRKSWGAVAPTKLRNAVGVADEF